MSTGDLLFRAARDGDVEAVKQLIARKVPVNIRDTHGNTPLWLACASQVRAEHKLAIAQLLIDSGAAVRHACENCSTALHQAAAHGPLALVELLLRSGAKEWQGDKQGKLPLDCARKSLAPDKDAIIETLDRPVIRHPIFKSAVRAIHAGDVSELQTILRQHPDLVQQRAIEPDCYPASYFSNPKLLWFVANNPTLIEKMPANLVQITRAILAVDPSREDVNYTLGLVMTSSRAREQHLQQPLMKVLLDHGAQPGDLLSVLAHRELEPVRFLLQQGMAVTAPIAAALGLADQLRLLLAAADAKTRQAALGIAVINQQLEAAKVCLAAGADVNALLPIHAHSTAVHQAAANDDMEMLKLLIAAGGRSDIRDTMWNATPLSWAIHTGKPAAEAYLRSIQAT